MTPVRHSLKLSAAVWVALATMTLAGCGEDGPHRIHVAGNVTWKGQPIPSGYVTFSPDVKQGNTGPQGIAWIKEGKFDTRFSKGRGASPGAQVMHVYGYDGVNPSEEHPWGAPIFLRYESSIVVKEPADPVDIVVPETVPPAPK
jgi:hypothetical protein